MKKDVSDVIGEITRHGILDIRLCMIRGLGTNISHSSKLSGLPAQMAIEGGWKMARSI